MITTGQNNLTRSQPHTGGSIVFARLRQYTSPYSAPPIGIRTVPVLSPAESHYVYRPYMVISGIGRPPSWF